MIKFKNMEVEKMSEELFEVLVARHFKEGKSKADAILAAMAEDPEAHRRYIDRVNIGGYNFLPDVFESK